MRHIFVSLLFLSALSLCAQTDNVKMAEDLLQFRVLSGLPQGTAGQENGVFQDFSRYVGLLPTEAVGKLGPPMEIYPQRGDKVTEDMVIFYYSNHLYLYWFENRVWQIRADRRYAGSVMGVTMGMGRRSVLDKLGMPYYMDSASVIYRLPDRGYPVKARLFFTADVLEDVYIYRGDY